ncbi:hypothetical protein I6N90_06075 [Paenibacillus sp. GSMTC-2017]|uniref:hypothetical protein n=1 Tax=Paenibacillus sp. GSMTC-2017 TaxID=2794350 RepID=UPI0018D6D5E7|nr:hypothetical protein [Paenibacillus sp. GSMTC-2017]MBH5317380.1 hypothetical protein [Paenibacillus sp. GSMTC-2017]
MRNVTRAQAKKLVGKSIFAMRKDGTVVKGKLLRIQGNKLIMAPIRGAKGKKVHTKWFLIPLLLFDLLAIGTLGFWGGGFGGGFNGGFGGGFNGGCGCGCGGNGFGHGNGGFF